MGTVLKGLLHQRHLQTYANFARAYEKAAAELDPEISNTYPSRSQFHRWLDGKIKSLPYANHCRVLEQMFPGWSAAQLLAAEPIVPHQQVATVSGLVDMVTSELGTPTSTNVSWEQKNENIPFNHAPVAISDEASGVARKLVMLARAKRWKERDLRQLARLHGHVVETDLRTDIDINQDGNVSIIYRRELLNLTDRPVRRLVTQTWGEHVPGRIEINPGTNSDRNIKITRIHETKTHLRYACDINPPIAPGEMGAIGIESTGFRLVSDHYWCLAIPRYTKQLTIQILHRGLKRLTECHSFQELENGEQRSADNGLIWNHIQDGVTILQTCDYLNPGQTITVRWNLETNE
ncbi:MAG: hypothetical protein HOQ05_05575 [Corynebacteriales bacterium]|nr:hypothetical protein [Mycobacteriales bacterium]